MSKFLVVKDFKTPVVYSGGAHPKMQSEVKYIGFKKGSIIDGKVKLKPNGETDYIIHKGSIVIPIAAVKELTLKDVVSNVSGEDAPLPIEKRIIPESKSKVKYIDSAIIGGVIGLGVVWIAEKKGWLVEQEESKIPHQNKLIGIAVGALLGFYYTHRKNVQTGIKIVKDNKNK